MRLMAMLSRREFGGAVMAGLPLAALMRPEALSAAEAAIGVGTSSFSDLPRVTDDEVLSFIRKQLNRNDAATASSVLRAIRNAGLGCEQHRLGRLFRSLQESA